jgi:hypothetical protein
MARVTGALGRFGVPAVLWLAGAVGCSGQQATQPLDRGLDRPRHGAPESPSAAPALAVAPSPLAVERVPQPELPLDEVATGSARFLAGLPPRDGSALGGHRDQPFWQEHARVMAVHWTRFDHERLARVRRFSQAELTAQERRSAWVFYPFGGPDLLFADAFFPHSPMLVLSGLEPVGEVPELERLTAPQLMTALRQLRESIGPALSLGYFITTRMEEALAGGVLRGALPILYVFLARTGHQILAVQPLELDAFGVPQPAAEGRDALVPGVRIRCQREGQPPRLVYYFRANVLDSALRADGRFAKFVRRHGQAGTLLKCGSYLMHEPRFSEIRRLVLETSTTVVQDPSGIPYRDFEPARWSVSLYGSYRQPIARFAHRDQPELRRAFSNGAIGTLDFEVGYQSTVDRSSLLVARRREDPPAER